MRPRKESSTSLLRSNSLTELCCCGCSEDNGKRYRPCNFTKVVMVLCIFCVIISIAVAVLVAVVYIKFNHLSHKVDKDFAFCVPCDGSLWREKGPIKDVVRQRKMYNGKPIDMCCGHDINILNNKVDKLVNSKVEKELLAQRKFCLEPDKVTVNTSIRPTIAAHLVLRMKHHTNLGGDGLYKIEGWDHSPNQPSVVRRHVKYRQGGMRVNKTGLFYVYSQVHFIQQKNEHTRAVSHSVYRYNRNLPNTGERRILHNSVSMCSNDNMLSHTSYVGCVVYLESGDSVYVKVNNWTSVHPNPAVTYFGLLMMDTHQHTDILNKV